MSRAHVPESAPTISVASQANAEARVSRTSRLVQQIKRRLSRLGGVVGTSMGTAVERPNEVISDAIVLPIVQEGEHSMNLIEITPSTPPRLFEPTDYDHVWCLVVDEKRFTWQGAAAWILKTRELNVNHYDRHLPTITLILRLDQLSGAELNTLSSQLTPIGVLLTRWPEDATSVEEAFHIIRAQLQDNYGEPNFDRQVRWGHSLIREGRSNILQTV